MNRNSTYLPYLFFQSFLTFICHFYYRLSFLSILISISSPLYVNISPFHYFSSSIHQVTGMYERLFDRKIVMQEPRGNAHNFDAFIREFERQIQETKNNSGWVRKEVIYKLYVYFFVLYIS